MEVLDNNGDSIPGLYAAGNDAGGWESDTYCYVLSGTALAFAINSARIAGENAAGYIQIKRGTAKRMKKAPSQIPSTKNG
jgi:fumarate reductase flavoprotein subunit